MAPKEVLRPGRVAVKQRAGDDEDSAQSGSQTSGEDKVVKMAEAMKRRARSRREKRRNDISNAYKITIQELEDQTAQSLAGTSSRMMDRHKRRLESLQGLMRRRTAIETRMLVSIRNIENVFSLADRVLSFALGRRIQRLEA